MYIWKIRVSQYLSKNSFKNLSYTFDLFQQVIPNPFELLTLKHYRFLCKICCYMCSILMCKKYPVQQDEVKGSRSYCHAGMEPCPEPSYLPGHRLVLKRKDVVSTLILLNYIQLIHMYSFKIQFQRQLWKASVPWSYLHLPLTELDEFPLCFGRTLYITTLTMMMYYMYSLFHCQEQCLSSIIKHNQCLIELDMLLETVSNIIFMEVKDMKDGMNEEQI